MNIPDGSYLSFAKQQVIEDTVPFITTWQTIIGNEMITIPTQGAGYDYTIDWGDGTIETKTSANPSHVYTTPGTHTIKITGAFPRIYLGGNATMAAKIRSVEQWGDIEWTSMEKAF